MVDIPNTKRAEPSTLSNLSYTNVIGRSSSTLRPSSRIIVAWLLSFQRGGLVCAIVVVRSREDLERVVAKR